MVSDTPQSVIFFLYKAVNVQRRIIIFDNPMSSCGARPWKIILTCECILGQESPSEGPTRVWTTYWEKTLYVLRPALHAGKTRGKKKSIFRIYSLYIYYKDDKKKKKQAIPYGIAAHTACGSKSAITKLLFRHLIIWSKLLNFSESHQTERIYFDCYTLLSFKRIVYRPTKMEGGIS